MPTDARVIERLLRKVDLGAAQLVHGRQRCRVILLQLFDLGLGGAKHGLRPLISLFHAPSSVCNPDYVRYGEVLDEHVGGDSAGRPRPNSPQPGPTWRAFLPPEISEFPYF